MNIGGGGLAGNQVVIGYGNAAPTNYNFNLTDTAVLSVTSASGSQVDATVNVSGNVDALLGSSYPSTTTYIVNLSAGSVLHAKYSMNLSGGIIVNAAPGALFYNDSNSAAYGPYAVINADVVGTGSFRVASGQSNLSFLKFGCSVAEDQAVTVAADPQRGKATLLLDDPKDFHTQINIASGAVELKIFLSGSYTYHNEVLDLFWQGRVVQELRVHLQDPLPGLVGAQPLTVERHGANIVISQGVTYLGAVSLFDRG